MSLTVHEGNKLQFHQNSTDPIAHQTNNMMLVNGSLKAWSTHMATAYTSLTISEGPKAAQFRQHSSDAQSRQIDRLTVGSDGAFEYDLNNAMLLDTYMDPAQGDPFYTSMASTPGLDLGVALNGDFGVTRVHRFAAQGMTREGTFELAATQSERSDIHVLMNTVGQHKAHIVRGEVLNYTLLQKADKLTLGFNATTQSQLETLIQDRAYNVSEIHELSLRIKHNLSTTVVASTPMFCNVTEDVDCLYPGTLLQLHVDTGGLVLTSNVQKNVTIQSVTNDGCAFGLNETGHFDTTADLIRGTVHSTGVGSTHVAHISHVNGTISVAPTLYDHAHPLDINTRLECYPGAITTRGHQVAIRYLLASDGLLVFTATGNQTLVHMTLTGLLSFTAENKQTNTFTGAVTLWNPLLRPPLPALKRQHMHPEDHLTRDIYIATNSSFEIATPFITIATVFSERIVVDALKWHVMDGANMILFEGPLTPHFEFAEEAWGNVTSMTPYNIEVANTVSWDPSSTMLHPKQDDDWTCLQPRLVCTRPVWSEIAIQSLSAISCNSRLTQVPNATCADTQSIVLETNGNPFVCYVADPNNETGWTLLINPSHYDSEHLSIPLKQFVISMYAIHLAIVVLSYVMLDSVIVEGWMAIAITSFFPRATPAYGWSHSALSIVNSARFIVTDWWAARTGGKGICNDDLSNMIPGWAVITAAMVCMATVLIQHLFLSGEAASAHPRKVIFLDGVLRLSIALGLFLLSIPAVAHLHIPNASAPYTGFIVFIVLASLVSLIVFFSYWATEKPRWMSDPPGWLGISIWSKTRASAAFLVFVLIRTLVPGIMDHVLIPADGLPALGVGITLIFLTALTPLLKEYWFTKQLTTTKKQSKEAPPQDDEPASEQDVVEYTNDDVFKANVRWGQLGALGFFSFAYFMFGTFFLVVYYYWPYTPDRVYVVLWALWVGPISLFYPVFEAVRFVLAKKYAAEGVHEYELQHSLYQQF